MRHYIFGPLYLKKSWLADVRTASLASIPNGKACNHPREHHIRGRRGSALVDLLYHIAQWYRIFCESSNGVRSATLVSIRPSIIGRVVVVQKPTIVNSTHRCAKPSSNLIPTDWTANIGDSCPFMPRLQCPTGSISPLLDTFSHKETGGNWEYRNE